MSDETPTALCLACRYAIPVGGVTGFAVPVACPRCATVHAVDADGSDVFRVRLGPSNGGLTPRDKGCPDCGHPAFYKSKHLCPDPPRPGASEVAVRRRASAEGEP